MPRGYEEGRSPRKQKRQDAIERRVARRSTDARDAGSRLRSTEADEPARFLGWADEVDAGSSSRVRVGISAPNPRT
jgi:hypothetical protein